MILYRGYVIIYDINMFVYYIYIYPMKYPLYFIVFLCYIIMQSSAS